MDNRIPEYNSSLNPSLAREHLAGVEMSTSNSKASFIQDIATRLNTALKQPQTFDEFSAAVSQDQIEVASAKQYKMFSS